MVVVTNQSSAVRLFFETGFNQSGDPVYSSRTYSNVKPTASEDDVYALAGLLAQLQDYPLGRVNRVDNADIEEL